MPLNTGKANCDWGGCSSNTPSPSMSSTLGCSSTKATGRRSRMRTATRSGHRREIEASSTQSISRNRPLRSSRGMAKTLRSKSPANTLKILARAVNLRPSISSASGRSRDKLNCGSALTNRRTLSVAMAAEAVSSASAITPATIRHRTRPFFCSFAMLLARPRFEPGQHLLARLPDITGDQRNDHVALPGHAEQRLHAAIDGSDVLHVAMTELADALDQRLGRRPGNRFFRSGVDIHHEKAVGLVKGPAEFVH